MAELVSIVVIAYNSAATIRETLESCYRQTYPNIEVVVADDGSRDDTVEVARTVATEHPTHRTIIVANPENAGITRNCKSGLDAAHGTWAKVIGADDLLLPSGIADLVACGNGRDADVVFSQFKSFGGESRLYPRPWTAQRIGRRNLDRAMLMGFGNVAPGAMVRLATLRKEGLPSLRTVMAEDTMFYDLACKGYRFAFCAKVTVLFRVHRKQITSGEGPVASILRSEQEAFFRDEVVRRLGAWHPFVLHVRYQRLVNRLAGKAPGRLASVARLLDPVFVGLMHLEENFPWQRKQESDAPAQER